MKKKFSVNAVGISSLLVIFAVLSLSIFALLAISTVQAQVRLAESTRKTVTDYYAADCRAEEILAQLRRGICPEGVEVNGEMYAYTCPISQTQELQVQVRLHAGAYTVTQWQTVSTVQWEPDDKLPVWGG